MDAILKELVDAPLANLLILGGLFFLTISVVGTIRGKIEPGKSGRILAGVLGGILVVVGLVLHAREHMTAATVSSTAKTANATHPSLAPTPAPTPQPKPEAKSTPVPPKTSAPEKHVPPKGDGGDRIEIVSVWPKSGTPLRRGRPFRFHVTVRYVLASADKAILALYAEEFPRSAGGCDGPVHQTNGGNFVHLDRGARDLLVHVSWIGDTDESTKRQSYGTGYVSLGANLWNERDGGSVQPLIRSFDTNSAFCYPFSP